MTIRKTQNSMDGSYIIFLKYDCTALAHPKDRRSNILILLTTTKRSMILNTITDIKSICLLGVNHQKRYLKSVFVYHPVRSSSENSIALYIELYQNQQPRTQRCAPNL